ncbi:MAG: right-handed parallel beta-helix repeat-containing protein [Oligoflexales bacterium]
MKKIVSSSLVLASTLLISTAASAGKYHRYSYDYYRYGKVDFVDGQCKSIAYDKKVYPTRKYRNESRCMALNPEQEASQNRKIDPNGDLQQAVRDQSDAFLIFERRHDLSENDAAFAEMSLEKYAERLYVGESALLRYQELKAKIQQRIDRLQNYRYSRYYSYYRYYKISWYKRYVRYVDRKISYIEQTYNPYAIAKIDDFQDQLGKNIIVEEDQTFDYANIDDALSFSLITQSQRDDIFSKKDRADAASALIEEKGFTCDDSVLSIAEGRADQVFSSLGDAINAVNSETTILVGNNIAREDITVSTSQPLTLISQCDTEINTLTMIVTEDLVIDGFSFENRTHDGQATVAMSFITSDVLFVNNRVTQGDISGSAVLLDADESQIWILGNEISDHNGSGIVVSNPINSDNVLIANNLISGHQENGILINSDRDVSLLRNDIENNVLYGLARSGFGTSSKIQIIENNIINNSGSPEAGISTSDVQSYTSFFDASDIGNITTTGDEGSEVEAL